MSTVSNVGNTPSSLLSTLLSIGSTPSASEADEASSSSVPVYESLPFQRLSFETLGLGLPGNIGSVDVLLAQVTMALEKSVDQARSDKLKAELAAYSSSLGEALANLINQAAVQAELDTLNTQKATLETDLTAAQAQLATDQQSLASAQSDYANASASYTYWNDKLATIDQSKDPSGYAAALANRNQAASAMSSAASRITAASVAISSDQAKIADLQNQIATVQGKIDTKTAELNTLQTGYVTLFAQISQMQASLKVETTPDVEAHEDQLDIQFEDFYDRLEAASADIAKVLKEFSEAQDVRDRDINMKKLIGATIALAAGLVALVEVLRDLAPAPQVNANQEAIQQGSRMRVSA